MWGATSMLFIGLLLFFISIHAPRVGSDHPRSPTSVPFQNFNPRSPCGERPRVRKTVFPKSLFQSTLPVWGATRISSSVFLRMGCISIHAPRVGSDLRFDVCFSLEVDFNPRSPCGERLITSRFLKMRPSFQSTLPVWGATSMILPSCISVFISIHAPRVGSDPSTLIR